MMFVKKIIKYLLVGLFFLSLLFSCEKENEPLKIIRESYDSVNFHVNTNTETIIKIDHWPTSLWAHGNGVYRTPAYDVVRPESDSTIYGRKYVVYIRIDGGKFFYLGYGISVRPDNYVQKDSLNPEFIEVYPK